MKRFTCAVIVAAGKSTRMGLEISKTLINLNEKPAIFYSLQAFQLSEHIDEIVLVCREQDRAEMEEIAKQFPKFKCTAIGGETRMQSVYSGIRKASDEAKYYAIHDGARALITKSDIDKVVEAAYISGAATLGTQVVDTIKIVNTDLSIKNTPDRSKLYAVQTPQVFEKTTYIKAIEYAMSNDIRVTDDCSLLEIMGERVQIVEGFTDNIKLTNQNDIVRAQIILEGRI